MRNRKELRTLRRKIGNNIREVRIKRNYTLQHLAKICKLNPLHIDDFEMGKRSITLDIVALIARGLEVPMDRLFE